MDIKLNEVTVRDLVEGYADDGDEGVVGYGGKLDIRPQYQREFIYKEEQRNAVIDTILKNFPLNVMYWSVQENGDFEIIDGQQRTISICQYIKGDFSIGGMYFHTQQDDIQKKILDYKLMVYLCSGTNSEKLDWFRTINIAGEELSAQELRNAVYAGSWVTDAKRHFSKRGCAAYELGKDFVRGSAIRQEYLETVIRWISKNNIEEYMGKNQHEQNANILWQYFQAVIAWVKSTFGKPNPRFMKGVNWGLLYDSYKDRQLNTDEIEKEISRLMMDDDVTRKSGIYPYILTRDEWHLSIRSFSDSMKQKAFERQGGICVNCQKEFKIDQTEADHITPWHEGGRTIDENCQILCKNCNRRKSGK